MKTNLIFLFLLFLITYKVTSQEATIKGRVTDEQGKPIENVTVTHSKYGTSTNSKGEYQLQVPPGNSIEIKFSHLSLKTYSRIVSIRKGKTLEFSPKLQIKTEEIDELILKDDKDEVKGVVNIEAEIVKDMPSITGGVEGVLRTLPGVNFNNELSSQYNVRGGSFDENLVYVNGVEVYRPFLVRSGAQEGLSFVNPNLTQNIEFSAGGFPAKYGDKLSSVLDITYKKPSEFSVGIEASLLGASLTLGGASKNSKLKGIIGGRYRNTSLILNTSDENSNFKPNYTDVQGYLSYDISTRFTLDFLGTYSLNKYKYTPISRQTNFGGLSNPRALVVNYRGKEEDKYETVFGALTGIYRVNDDFTLNFTTSAYNTHEQEYFDILAFYGIGDVNTDLGSEDFGNIDFIQSIGTQLDHARNNLTAKIANASVKGTIRKNTNLIEFGIKYQYEQFKDRIIEWQVIDSAGFSLRPPNVQPRNDEPYTPYTGPIIPYTNVRATNNVITNRISGYGQWSKKTSIKDNIVWFNIGLRAQHWTVDPVGIKSESQFLLSPRGKFTIKPNWKNETFFRLSAGYYQQPPFYREMRDSLGVVHPEVKAQKSLNIVVGYDYTLQIWDRPFKIVAEAYYKKLSDVNPFTIDNVKIRYRAKNNAIAYARGIDFRLNGEFVPGTESWLSIGYLETKENIEDRGYISRPTDQRLKFAILFQDYVPKIPQLKFYLNLVYNTGVPGGSPSYADPYLYQNRLKDYFRSDIGISYVIVDSQNPAKKKWQEVFKDFSVGLELYNMFDTQNSITNTWVKDISSNQYVGIPNYLSGRVLNIMFAMRF